MVCIVHKLLFLTLRGQDNPAKSPVILAKAFFMRPSTSSLCSLVMPGDKRNPSMLRPTRHVSYDNSQVWSLHQFSCVGVLLSRIGVTTGAFHLSTIDVFSKFLVTFAPIAAHLTIMKFFLPKSKNKLNEIVRQQVFTLILAHGPQLQ